MWIELLNGNSMLLQNHALKAVKSIKKEKLVVMFVNNVHYKFAQLKIFCT